MCIKLLNNNCLRVMISRLNIMVTCNTEQSIHIGHAHTAHARTSLHILLMCRFSETGIHKVIYIFVKNSSDS